MVGDVALAPPAGPVTTPARPGRVRRVVAVVLLTLAGLVTGLSALVLVACWRDDSAIEGHLGHATADVLSVSFARTAIRFVTPGGAVVIPDNGVLYPGGLAAGERVRIEYDTTDPDRVRVAGRDARLALLPAGSTVAATWLVAGPALWWLRRSR